MLFMIVELRCSAEKQRTTEAAFFDCNVLG